MNAASRSLRRRPRDDGERARFLFDLDTRQKRTKENEGGRREKSGFFHVRMSRQGRSHRSIDLATRLPIKIQLAVRNNTQPRLYPYGQPLFGSCKRHLIADHADHEESAAAALPSFLLLITAAFFRPFSVDR